MRISPTTTANCLGRLGLLARFGPEEIAGLEAAMPAPRDGFMTFPTPNDNASLSVLGLREVLGVTPAGGAGFFDHPWYLDEPFGREPCTPGWHVVATSVVPASVGRPVYFAEELKKDSLFLATASEVLLMLFLQFAASGERLLERKHTWTRDRTEKTGARRFVSIGAFGKKGVFVSSHEVGYKSRGLGICPTADPG